MDRTVKWKFLEVTCSIMLKKTLDQSSEGFYFGLLLCKMGPNLKCEAWKNIPQGPESKGESSVSMVMVIRHGSHGRRRNCWLNISKTNTGILLRHLCAGQKATIKTAHGTTNWLKIGKGVCQGCILSPCLFKFYAEYMMEMQDWMKHKLESRLLGEISITSNMQMTPPLQQKAKRTLWWKWKKRVKKLGENSTFKKLRLCHPVPSLHDK